MMKKILILIVLLFFTAGCLADVQNEESQSSETEVLSSEPDGKNSETPVSTANEISTEVDDSVLPTKESSDSNEAITLTEGNEMPIFLEITQTTILSTGSSQVPNIGVGPAVYIYQSDNRVLYLQSSIEVDPGTQLLIGQNDILQTPDMTYERKGILQYPTETFTLMQVAGYEPDTGTLTLVYGGETFSLSPGESWTDKQVAEGGTPTLITTVTNYGRLNGIETLTTDGSPR
ncbi:MAG: hypothetical protein P8Y68_16675 [Anaerolineales bacterium]